MLLLATGPGLLLKGGFRVKRKKGKKKETFQRGLNRASIYSRGPHLLPRCGASPARVGHALSDLD